MAGWGTGENGGGGTEGSDSGQGAGTVSYTHLTLPTKLSV